MLQTKSIDGQKRPWVISHVRMRQIWMSKRMLCWLFFQQTLFGTLRCAHGWVMSHIWISCVAHRIALMDESNHTFERHVAHVTESCHIHQRCTSHMWISHVTCMKCAMSHMWMSRYTYIDESWHTYESWCCLPLLPNLLGFWGALVNKSCHAHKNNIHLHAQGESETNAKGKKLPFPKVPPESQVVAVCCSVFQCVAAWSSVVQGDAVWCSVLKFAAECCNVFQCVAMCCSVLQCAAVCCSVLQCVAAYCNAL